LSQPDTAAAQRLLDDEANDRFVAAHLKRNFIANFGHGMLGMTGFRLVNAPTFVPAYVFMLTGSSVMVGVSQALQQAGAIMSPLLSASAIEDKARILPNAVRTGLMMRLQLLGLALSGWWLSGPWLVGAIFLFLFLFGYFNGAQRVTFQMLMAKVIPLAQRGRLQGYRNLAGGAIAAVLSWWAGSTLIANNTLGNGYATTFMLSFILTSLGLLVLTALIREPDSHRRRPAMKLRSRLRELPQLLDDRSYKFFLVAQLFAAAGRIGVPFCILHAGQVMQLDGHALGLFSFAFLGADTVANLGWGAIGDRKGFRLVFLAAILVWIGGFGLMLVAADTPGFVIGFAALGAASSGYMMSAQTLVLEFGAREDMPMRLALSTTAETSVAAIGPLIGGVVATALGFASLIGLSIALLVVALAVLLFLVGDPRHSRRDMG
jgi:MFS family permease